MFLFTTAVFLVASFLKSGSSHGVDLALLQVPRRRHRLGRSHWMLYVTCTFLEDYLSVHFLTDDHEEGQLSRIAVGRKQLQIRCG